MPEVRVVTNLNAKPGAARDYVKAWDADYEVVNGQPGCVQYELFHSTRNPENLALVQHWESSGAFHSYWAIHKVRPAAGEQFIDAPENRKVGRSGTEIYWNLKYYRPDGDVWVPLDGQPAPEEQANHPVRLVINATAKEGMRDAYIQAWSPHYDEVNGEPGCLQYELFASTRHEQNLLLLEHWASRSDFRTHWALERSRPNATREFQAAREERKVGRGGLEIYYKLQYTRWDGKTWLPVED